MKKEIYFVTNEKTHKVFGIFDSKTKAQKQIKAYISTLTFVLNNNKEMKKIIKKDKPQKIRDIKVYLNDFKNTSLPRLFYRNEKKEYNLIKKYGFDSKADDLYDNLEIPLHIGGFLITKKSLECKDEKDYYDKINLLLNYFNLVDIDEYFKLSKEEQEKVYPIIGPIIKVYEGSFTNKEYCF